MNLRIFAPEEMIETEITLPLSKSMGNRALLIDALTPGNPGRGVVADTDASDDYKVMAKALDLPPKGDINIGAAGTAMRFLTAYYAATPGADVTLDGSPRMRKRPISALVDALRALGAEIEYVGSQGYPPLHIKGSRLNGGRVEIDATLSSQFVSALLMVAPTFDASLTVVLKGEPSSRPYIAMTIEMMRHRGIDVVTDYDEIIVPTGTYTPTQVPDIERDWSAASYWYSIAALSAGWVTLPGLKYPSVQGDSRLVEIYEKLGVLTNADDEREQDDAIELSASPEVYSRLEEDLSETPDIVQTLVVSCCMVGVPFCFTGVHTLRIKETDRLEALRTEMLKLGCIVEIERDNIIKWEGRRIPITEVPEIETYGDHRMAMAFAPAALYASGMVIKDVEVVSKSYPGFWADLRKAGFVLADASIPLTPQAEE